MRLKKLTMIFAGAVMSMTGAGCGKATATEQAAENKPEENNELTANDNETEMGTKVKVETNLGTFTVLLYNDTPKHRDNFVKLAREGYYDGMLFHRVINEFMVQGGDPDSKNAAPGARLGSGGPGYTLEAEIDFPKHFHKRGALAAARQGDQVNPERRSSGSQFYIVTGNKYSADQLSMLDNQLKNQQMQGEFNRLASQHIDQIRQMQAQGDMAGLQALQQQLIGEAEAAVAANPMKLTPEMRQAYETVGGAPHLDGQYTVFGEVVDGMDVIDRIEKVETDGADRPVNDVVINKMTVL